MNFSFRDIRSMKSAIFSLPSYETSSDDGTWKMHKENPQMTPVPSSGATGQAQIGADKKERWKLIRQDLCLICAICG